MLASSVTAVSDDPESVRTAYDTVAESYARLLPGPTAEAPLDLAVVDDFARRVRGAGPVLDAGCGPGRMSRYLHDRGVDVTGLDLSSEMVRVARRHHPDLRFMVGSIEALPVRSGSLAGVLAWYSLIHVPPVAVPAAVGELLRVLAPGGWLLIGAQSGSGSRHIGAAYGHELDLTAHLHTADRLAELITEQHGQVHVRLTRGTEQAERNPQAFVLARR